MRNENGSHSEFIIPTRGLFGLEQNSLPTLRVWVLSTQFFIIYARPGQLARTRTGLASGARNRCQQFVWFIKYPRQRPIIYYPAVQVYKGQVVGQNARSEDISVNVCGKKALSNMRSKGDGKAEHFNSQNYGLGRRVGIYRR